MYAIVLILHSWIRWAVLALGVAATGAAFGDRAERPSRFLMMAADLQMLLGIVLYLFLSPYTQTAMSDFGAAMRTPQLRFWAVEHAVSMIVAVALIHIGRVAGRTSARRRTWHIVTFGLATALMLVATPWPGTPNARPLFRLSS